MVGALCGGILPGATGFDQSGLSATPAVPSASPGFGAVTPGVVSMLNGATNVMGTYFELSRMSLPLAIASGMYDQKRKNDPTRAPTPNGPN